MNLNLIPASQHASAIVNIIRQSGGIIANEAIQSVADVHGDKAAGALIAQLPATAIVSIVKEFDITKPSIVAELLTPLQLRDVIERLPLHRTENQTGGVDVDSNACDLLCAVILPHKEDNTHGKYFRELGKSELCILALATAFPADEMVYFSHSGRFTADGDDIDEGTVKVGEWEELLFTLRKSAKAVFYQVLEVVKTSRMHSPRINLYQEYLELARKTFKPATSTVSDPYAEVA